MPRDTLRDEVYGVKSSNERKRTELFDNFKDEQEEEFREFAKRKSGKIKSVSMDNKE